MISFQEVTHYYQQHKALDSIHCDLPSRKCIALLGENGAGKSTLMKLLVGNLHASSGKIFINGNLMYPESEARRLIGYLPERLSLYKGMKVIEYLKWLGKMHDLDRTILKVRLEWVTQYCQLAPLLSLTMNQLSKGMQQRVGLAQALLHDPPMIVLDEVHSGLDHQQSITINTMLKQLSHEHLVLVSTHRLHTIAQIADQAMILDQGKLCAFDTLEHLMMSENTQRIDITINNQKISREIDQSFSQLCHRYQIEICHVVEDDFTKRYECYMPSHVSSFLRDVSAQFDLIEAKHKTDHLTDIFSKLTKKD